MFSTRNLVQIAMMAAVVLVLGFVPAIPLGFIPAPIVLQNLGVMLVGILLGGKKGTLAMVVFLLLSLVIPAFSGSNTLIPVLMGPTAGYVVSWLLVPSFIAIGERLIPQRNALTTFLIIWVSAVVIADIIGAIWLAVYLDNLTLTASLLSNLAFLPGDTLKAIVATLVAIRFKAIFSKE